MFTCNGKILKNLIIVESPTKAKTIKNFLGKNYTVIASKGHIRDLPKSSFGIKIEGQTFTPEYRVSKDHSAIVKEMKDDQDYNRIVNIVGQLELALGEENGDTRS